MRTEPRRSTRSSLPTVPRRPSYHVEFRQILLQVSTELFAVAAGDIEPGIARALERIGRFVGCDVCSLFLFDHDGERFHVVQNWVREGVPDEVTSQREFDGAIMPWGHPRRLRGESVVIHDVSQLPPQAAVDRASFEALGVRSVADVPLVLPDGRRGFVGFASVAQPKTWTEDEVSLLSLVAQMLAHLMALRRALDTAHDSEARFKAAAMCTIDVLAEVDFARTRQIRFYGDIARLLRLPPSRVPKTVEELLAHQHPDDLPKTRLKMERVMTTGEDYLNQSRYLRGDGSVVHCELRATVTRFDDGKPTRWIVAITDITERHRAEEDLRDALGQLASLRDRLQAENVYLQEEIDRSQNFQGIVGRSRAIADLLRQVDQVAPTDSTVLVLGETGTGKELFAHAIHRHSSRSDRPLVKVNCAALPGAVVESELFGHEKGAFTGAIAERVGRFELADGGTLFLDEIGDLSREIQAKLLRVLQEGEFERVGSSQTRKTDVRLIVATHRNLEEAIASGRFREDLFYRLSVFPLRVPPLRDRREDIPDLVRYFVERLAKKMQKPVQAISSTTMQALQSYDWPGNVRELQNVVERAMILSRGTELVLPVPSLSAGREMVASVGRSLKDVERAYIEETLRACGGHIKGPGNAAARLGMKASTLYSRMKRLGIERRSRRR